MTYEYWTLYKPETKQRLDLRYNKMWDEWENLISYDHINHETWKRLPQDLLSQLPENIRKYGFKTPRNLYYEKYYQEALIRANELMDAKPNTVKAYELELLTETIEKYENEHYPMGIDKE